MAISRPRTCYLSRHALPLSKPCFEISSKVLMREISRVRQQPPGSQDFTPPEVLTEELNRMMGWLEMLIPVYPIIGKAASVRWHIFYTNKSHRGRITVGVSLREMRTSMQIWTSTENMYGNVFVTYSYWFVPVPDKKCSTHARWTSLL